MITTIRLAMNGESPTIAPVSGFRSGAPGGSVRSAIAATTPTKAQSAARSPFASFAGRRPSPGSFGTSPWYGPRRGSTTRSVTTVQTTASTRLEMTEK
jgi:hypothetical protein